MKEIQAEVTQISKFKFTFDKESPEFKQAFDDYQSVIAVGDHEDMIEHIGYYVCKFESIKKMVEGVGYLAPKDGEPFGDPWSGIFVEVVYEDEWDFDVKTIELQTVS